MSPINYSNDEVADSKQGHEGIGKKLETWQIAFCLWEIGWLQCPNSPSGSVGGECTHDVRTYHHPTNTACL